MKSNDDLISYYSARLADTGTPWGAADCGSEASHRARLRALADVMLGDMRLKSVLDVGCGGGSFIDVLTPGTRYVGWDIVPEFIDTGARQEWPLIHSPTFQVRDLYDSTEVEAFDYVVASGLFQFAPSVQLERGVARMFALCRKAVAFNVLTRTDGTPGEMAVAPRVLLDLCTRLTPRVVLRTDYLPNDATVYLYK